MNKNLSKHAKDMAAAAKNGVGPDIVIVVSSSPHQADFWQGRLTGSDNIHGAGVVIKEEAIVLSVTESNWPRRETGAVFLSKCIQIFEC